MQTPIAKNPIRLLPGNIVEMALTQGQVAILDLDDLWKVAPYRWCAWRANARQTFYAISGTGRGGRRKGGVQLYMHRLLLLDSPMVDHRNGNGLDNRRGNLRPATASQNTWNAKRSHRNTSGYKGVHFYKQTSRWQAYIREDGRRRHLGFYATAEEAARAHDAAARRIRGAFARLNFPDDAETAA